MKKRCLAMFLAVLMIATTAQPVCAQESEGTAVTFGAEARGEDTESILGAEEGEAGAAVFFDTEDEIGEVFFEEEEEPLFGWEPGEETDGEDLFVEPFAEDAEEDHFASSGEMYTVDGIQGGRVQFDKSTGTITWLERGVTQADIPEMIDGVTVTTIGAWVGQNSNITKLTIPSTVTTFEEGVFRNTKITELTIPGNVAVISKNSFANNKLLKTVTIESGVTEIGDYCFTYCDELETLVMPGTLKKIGLYSFRSCSNLEYVTYDGRTDFYPFDGGEDRYVTCAEGCFTGAFFGHPDFSDSYKTGKWYQQLHAVTPTGDYLKDLMAIAESQMGYHEGNSLKDMSGTGKGSGDYAEYNYWWNEPGSKWCGEFAAWCLAMASIPYEIVVPKYQTQDSNGETRSFSWEDTVYAGGEQAYALKQGDVILFRYDGGNHVILVDSVTASGSAVTVESLNGNHSNDASRDTYVIDASTGKTTNEWTKINGHVDTIYSPDFSLASGLTYYTVNFDMQGGSADWSSKRLTNNASYGLMPLPVKSGYTFDGWYTEAAGGKKITSYRRVRLTGNQTLYAHWTTGGSSPTEPEKPEEEVDTSRWGFDKTTGTITSIPYDWTGGRIPSEIDGVAVKAIKNYACQSRKSITTLILPEGLETIGDYAFSNCSALESVTIPASVKQIGEEYGYVFNQCVELENVTFTGDASKIRFGGRGNFNGTLYMRSDFSEPYQRSAYYQKLLGVELTGDYIADAIAIAASQDGYHEGNKWEEMDGSNLKGNDDYAEMAYFTISPPYKWMKRKGLNEEEYQYGGWCGNFCNWCLSMASIPEELHAWWMMKEADCPRWSDTVYAGGAMGYELKAGDVLKMNIGHYCLVTKAWQEGDIVYVETWNGNHNNDVEMDTYELRANDGYNLGYARDYPSQSQDNGERYQIKWIEPYLPDELAKVELYDLTFDPNGGTLPANKTVKKLASSSFYGVMPVPVKEGSRFAGWYTAPEGGKKIGAYRKYNRTENQTLYAHWTQVEVQESSGSGMDPVPAVEISGTEGSVWLVKGQTSEIGAGAWKSDTPSVATVSKNGRITAKAKGSAVISGTSAEGAAFRLTVTVAIPAISEKSLRLVVGDTTQTPLSVCFDGADANRFTISYSSSNTAVATVDETGNVTGVGKGSAVIYGWVGGKSVACKVSVLDDPTKLLPKKLTNGQTIRLNPLQSYQLKTMTGTQGTFSMKNAQWTGVELSTGELVPMEEIKNSKDVVTGYRNEVIEITAGNGKIRAIGPGTTSIIGMDAASVKKVEAEPDKYSLSELNTVKFTITVKPIPTKTVQYLPAGKSVKLSFPYVKPAAASWALSDETGDTGCLQLVTAKNGTYTGAVRAVAGKSGTAVVNCQYMGFAWQTTVCAEDPSLSQTGGITQVKGLSYKLSMNKGASLPLTVQGIYQVPIWKSGKNAIVFVDEKGVLYARSKGTATVSTKVSGKTIKITITVE